MAAVLKTYVYTGAGGTGADSGDQLRFKNADNNTDDMVNPVQIPDAGTNYSFKKTICLHATTGPSVSISNVRVYTDGNNGFGNGVTVYAKAVSSYTQATDASQMTGGVDFFTKTQASPLTLTGTIGAGATGRGSIQYVELQMVVPAGATPGDLNAIFENLTWQFDEA